MKISLLAAVLLAFVNMVRGGGLLTSKNVGGGALGGIALDPTGSSVWTMAADFQVYKFDTALNQLQKTSSSYTNTVTAIAVSSGFIYIGSSANLNNIKKFDLFGNYVAQFSYHVVTVCEIQFYSTDGLLTLDSAGNHAIWTTANTRLRTNSVAGVSGCGSIVGYPIDQAYFVGGSNGIIYKKMAVNTWGVINQWNAHVGAQITRLVVDTATSSLYSAASDMTVKRWALVDNSLTKTFTGNTGSVLDLAVTTTMLYTIASDKRILGFELLTTNIRNEFSDASGTPNKMAVDTTGTYIYTSNDMGILQKYDLSVLTTITTTFSSTRRTTTSDSGATASTTAAIMTTGVAPILNVVQLTTTTSSAASSLGDLAPKITSASEEVTGLFGLTAQQTEFYGVLGGVSIFLIVAVGAFLVVLRNNQPKRKVHPYAERRVRAYDDDEEDEEFDYDENYDDLEIRKLTSVLKNVEAKIEKYKENLAKKEQEIKKSAPVVPVMDEQMKAQLSNNADEIKKLNEANAKMAAAMAAIDLERKQFEERVAEDERLRRQLHNTIQDLKGNIRVFCRVRNFSKDEPKDSKHIVLSSIRPTTISFLQPESTEKPITFTFDRVFPMQTTQEEVFSEITSLIQSVCDGYNVCIFAYGQTSSGKTFTMEGSTTSNNEELRGIIPRAVKQIFAQTAYLKRSGWEYVIEGSFLEIYNDEIKDLLAKPLKPGQKPIKYEIKHVPLLDKNIVSEVTGLEVVRMTTPEQVMALLATASSNRKVSATKMNAQSSRSHSVFTLTCIGTNEKRGEKCMGRLNLVDLAGSERMNESGVKGEQLRETVEINKSLSALGDVIAGLAAKSSHIPYRNSKLTYLLENCLGGDSKTLMFANVSPTVPCINESINTLRFASNVNQVRNRPATRAKTANAQLHVQFRPLSRAEPEVEAEEKV